MPDPAQACVAFVDWALAAVLVSILILCIGTGRASAHAVLLDTTPGNSESLAQSPAEIVLRFNEPVSPIKLHIIDSRGQRITGTGEISSVDQLLRLPLTAPLAEGLYVVSYRVVSIDSHPVAASFVFSVGEAPVAGTEMEEIRDQVDREGGSAIPAYLNRAIRYTTLLFAAGMALFLVLFQVPRAIAALVERGLAVAAAVGIGSSLLMIGLGGAQLSGVGLDGLLLAAIWSLGAKRAWGPVRRSHVLGSGP